MPSFAHRGDWRAAWLFVSDAPLALGSIESRILTADQLADYVSVGTAGLAHRSAVSSTARDA